ncbi:MAG: DDE-type integrase/transposase/recombinase [Janthinobacterium lividum]
MLDRQFKASAPNRTWLADITSIPTSEGWLCLTVVLDLFSRRVVGWSMIDTMPQELTTAALQMAITNRRPAPGLWLRRMLYLLLSKASTTEPGCIRLSDADHLPIRNKASRPRKP